MNTRNPALLFVLSTVVLLTLISSYSHASCNYWCEQDFPKLHLTPIHETVPSLELFNIVKLVSEREEIVCNERCYYFQWADLTLNSLEYDMTLQTKVSRQHANHFLYEDEIISLKSKRIYYDCSLSIVYFDKPTIYPKSLEEAEQLGFVQMTDYSKNKCSFNDPHQTDNFRIEYNHDQDETGIIFLEDIEFINGSIVNDIK